MTIIFTFSKILRIYWLRTLAALSRKLWHRFTCQTIATRIDEADCWLDRELVKSCYIYNPFSTVCILKEFLINIICLTESVYQDTFHHHGHLSSRLALSIVSCSADWNGLYVCQHVLSVITRVLFTSMLTVTRTRQSFASSILDLCSSDVLHPDALPGSNSSSADRLVEHVEEYLIYFSRTTSVDNVLR